MKILFIAGSTAGRKFTESIASLAWDITCVPTLEHAQKLLNRFDFQAIFVSTCDLSSEAYRAIESLERSKCATPIIACLPDDRTYNRIKAFESGAVATIQIPVNIDELEATVRAVVRYTKALTCKVISAGDLTLDFTEKRFNANGMTIPFTTQQYQLLEFLFLNKGKSVSRASIMNHLYSDVPAPQKKIVDVLICKIRQRLRAFVGEQQVIETVWGFGFRVIDESQNNVPKTFSDPRSQDLATN